MTASVPNRGRKLPMHEPPTHPTGPSAGEEPDTGRDPSADGGPVREAGPGRLPTVDGVAAVGSGKGGVGKSTVAASLALAASEGGLEVGLLDADIYGPSIPKLLGIEDAAERVEMTDDRKIVPVDAGGLPFVSFGFFLGEKSPAVWRGPLVAKAVEQVSRGVVWPELDLLVVDLPPGTGDTPLSLAKTVRVDGGVVVTTPQDLAVREARKAVEMFGALEVPVAGVIENMSHGACECGRRFHPFGRGGGRRLAEDTDVPLLAQIPFVAEEQRSGHRGEVAAPPSAMPDETATAFRAAARGLVEELSTRAAGDSDGAGT